VNKQVVTFGELMLRLEPPGFARLTQTNSLNMTFGGAEANVAVSLANYGNPCSYISKFPSNSLGTAAVNSLRQLGVDTGQVLWGGDRIGIYYTENGAAQRAPVVLYDRANSAIAQIKPGEINWSEIFHGKNWFHFTGITPALGEGPAAVTLEAVTTAKNMGLTVSCDFNYRSKLWSVEAAGPVMTELLNYVDVAIGIGEMEAEQILGFSVNDHGVGDCSSRFRALAETLLQKFKFSHVATTQRNGYSASDNGWSAMLYDGKDFYQSPEYNIHMVDRVGSGDAFCGSLLYALLQEYTPQKSIDFAAAASCLKHSIQGDYNHVTLAEVEALMAGDGSGRIRR
jgi:2-dehydro-3-deoxygluconokinase